MKIWDWSIVVGGGLYDANHFIGMTGTRKRQAMRAGRTLEK